MLSPATTSPWVPSSKNDCPAAPPIDVRSPDTVRPVLAGPVPGVTATVSSVAAWIGGSYSAWNGRASTGIRSRGAVARIGSSSSKIGLIVVGISAAAGVSQCRSCIGKSRGWRGAFKAIGGSVTCKVDDGGACGAGSGQGGGAVDQGHFAGSGAHGD